MSESRALLKHFLAAIAYRSQKALRVEHLEQRACRRQLD